MAAGNKPGVYIDSCCFVDMAKHKIGATLDNDRVNDVWHCKQLLRAHRDGHLKVYTSTLTVAECQHAGETPPPLDVQGLFRKLTISNALQWRLQYNRAIQQAGHVAGLVRVR